MVRRLVQPMVHQPMVRRLVHFRGVSGYTAIIGVGRCDCQWPTQIRRMSLEQMSLRHWGQVGSNWGRDDSQVCNPSHQTWLTTCVRTTWHDLLSYIKFMKERQRLLVRCCRIGLYHFLPRLLASIHDIEEPTSTCINKSMTQKSSNHE
jgi:hypothetical protein